MNAKNLQVEVDASQFGYTTKLTNPRIDYSARLIMFRDENFKTGLKVDPSKNQKLIIKIKGFTNPLNN